MAAYSDSTCSCAAATRWRLRQSPPPTGSRAGSRGGDQRAQEDDHGQHLESEESPAPQPPAAEQDAMPRWCTRSAPSPDRRRTGGHPTCATDAPRLLETESQRDASYYPAVDWSSSPRNEPAEGTGHDRDAYLIAAPPSGPFTVGMPTAFGSPASGARSWSSSRREPTNSGGAWPAGW